MEKEYIPYLTRRQYPRFKLESFAQIKQENGVTSLVMVRDISSRGIGCVSSFFLQPEEKVEVFIDEPFFNLPNLKKRGKVCWCKEVSNNYFRVGIDFTLSRVPLG